MLDTIGMNPIVGSIVVTFLSFAMNLNAAFSEPSLQYNSVWTSRDLIFFYLSWSKSILASKVEPFDLGSFHKS